MLEEEVGVALNLDRGANKREFKYHPFVISSPIPIGEFGHLNTESFIINNKTGHLIFNSLV